MFLLKTFACIKFAESSRAGGKLAKENFLQKYLLTFFASDLTVLVYS